VARCLWHVESFLLGLVGPAHPTNAFSTISIILRLIIPKLEISKIEKQNVAQSSPQPELVNQVDGPGPHKPSSKEVSSRSMLLGSHHELTHQ